MIQIDIKMPKCCDECFALDDHGDYPFCLISQDQRGYTFNTKEKRMSTCPLKAQEPRVMTLEEVKALAEDDFVWYEHVGINRLRPRVIYFTDCSCIVFTDGGKWYFEIDGYGKIWRCWTSRPTDEQREAVKWDG